MTSIAIDRSDGLSSSTAIKGPCRVATTTSIAQTGLPIIDGVQVNAGDRILDKENADARQRGIWIADTGPWRRAKDFNKSKDVVSGTQVVVVEGATQAGTWYVGTPNPILIGSTSLDFWFEFDKYHVAVASRAELLARTIPVGVNSVEQYGLSTAGDGGGAVYDYWNPADHSGAVRPEALLWEKCMNPDFLKDTLWTKPAGFVIGSNKGTATACTGDLTLSVNVFAGRTEEIKFRIANYSGGTVQALLNTTSETSVTLAASNDLFTVRIAYPGSDDTLVTTTLRLRMSNFTGELRNVSIKSVYRPSRCAIQLNVADGTTAWFLQRGQFNVKAMGHPGTAGTDAGPYWREAMLAGNAFNRGDGYAPNGTYDMLTTPLESAGIRQENIGMTGQSKYGVIVNHLARGNILFNIRGFRETSGIAITSAIPQNGRRALVTSPAASWFTAGSALILSDSSQAIVDGAGTTVAVSGEVNWVEAVESGSQLSLRRRLRFAYTTSTVLRKVIRCPNIRFSNFTVVQPNAETIPPVNGGNSHIFDLTTVEDAEISNIHFVGIQARAISIDTYCYNIRLHDLSGLNMVDDLTNLSYFIHMGNGGNHLVKVWNCFVDKCRHFSALTNSATEIEGDSIYFDNCIHNNSDNAGFDTHPGGARNLWYTNCHAIGCGITTATGQPANAYHGFQIRSRWAHIIDCSATNYYNGVLGVGSQDLHVRNFDAYSCGIGVSFVNSPRSTVRDLRVHGDHAQAVLVDKTVSDMERIEVFDVGVYGVTKGDYATGTVTLSTAVPADGDYVTINSHKFTFRTNPTIDNSSETEIQIDATGATTADKLTNTASSLVTAIGKSTQNINQVRASNLGGAVSMIAVEPGTAGNSYTIAKSGTNISISGANFSGGGGNLYAVYWADWEDSYLTTVTGIKLPTSTPPPKHGGSIPDYVWKDAVTVANLQAAATAGAGARKFVTDANTTTTLGIGTTVAAGGANKVPVYSDGTNWLIG